MLTRHLIKHIQLLKYINFNTGKFLYIKDQIDVTNIILSCPFSLFRNYLFQNLFEKIRMVQNYIFLLKFSI